MRSGKPAKIRPDSAKLEFTDGSLNNASTDLKLRCPDAATIACRFSDDEEKRCEGFDITYAGKCTFSSKILFYTFSDLKKAMLDLEGEIEVFGANGAEARFNSVSWKHLYSCFNAGASIHKWIEAQHKRYYLKIPPLAYRLFSDLREVP